SPPYIKAPTVMDIAVLNSMRTDLHAALSGLATLSGRLDRQSDWEQTISTSPPFDWSPTDGLAVHFSLNGDLNGTAILKDRSATIAGQIVDGTAKYSTGMYGQSAVFDGQRYISADDVGGFGFFDKFSISAWIRPTGRAGGTIVSSMTDAAEGDGYCFRLHDGKLEVDLTKRWLDDALRVETDPVIRPDRWQHVLVTYNGSRLAEGVSIYVNGEPQPLTVLLDELNQSFATKEPLRIGGGNGPDGRFHGLIDDVRVYERDLAVDDAEILATTESIPEIASLTSQQRTAAQSQKLQAYYLAEGAPEE